MARTNTPVRFSEKTHEGAPASRITPEQELQRSVLACLLWEQTFYESGQDIADRIASLVDKVDPLFVGDLAIKARSEYNLRHAPLWLLVGLARKGAVKAETIEKVIQRADEPGELLAMYWKNGRVSIPAQMKKGLAAALTRFDAYQLAKYDRAAAVRLRDVMFMTHAKPKDEAQGTLWKQLVDGTLPSPDTWEVGLSAGDDKKETWERLLRESNLGDLALLRNLRNMAQVNVDEALIRDAMQRSRFRRILPFRFIAASRAVPKWEPMIEEAMLRATETEEKLPAQTVVLVDVSGSMDGKISERSDLNRIDAAAALAILCREICETVRVFTFSQSLVEVPPRRGFALSDAISRSQQHGGTYLGAAVANLPETTRLIVFTDEQSHDAVGNPKAEKAYMVNVAANKNGIGYGAWTHIDGFSEAIVSYIRETEAATSTPTAPSSAP